MNLSAAKKCMDLENRLVVAQGEGREWDGLGAWSYKTQLRIDLQGDPTE